MHGIPLRGILAMDLLPFLQTPNHKRSFGPELAIISTATKKTTINCQRHNPLIPAKSGIALTRITPRPRVAMEERGGGYSLPG